MGLGKPCNVSQNRENLEEKTMYDEKLWWQSKGVWGGLVAALAGVAGLAGYVVDADSQAAIVEILLLVSGSVGGVLATVGRVKATKVIGKK